MPACGPVSETAFTPSAWSAMAVSAMVVCSPVASSTSSSRSFGSGMISFASRIRLSVTPLMAETTTTIWSPLLRYFATRAATFLMRSVLATEVPPYFWTINIRSFKILDAYSHRRAFYHRELADFLQGFGYCAIWRIVQHQNKWHTFSFMTFGLND